MKHQTALEEWKKGTENWLVYVTYIWAHITFPGWILTEILEFSWKFLIQTLSICRIWSLKSRNIYAICNKYDIYILNFYTIFIIFSINRMCYDRPSGLYPSTVTKSNVAKSIKTFASSKFIKIVNTYQLRVYIWEALLFTVHILNGPDHCKWVLLHEEHWSY